MIATFAKIIDSSTNALVVVAISTADPLPAIGNVVATAIGRRAKLSIRIDGDIVDLDDDTLTQAYRAIVANKQSAITIIANL
jgi:hypothetical protein